MLWAVAIIGIVLLLAVGAAYLWQERRPADAVREYVLTDAVAFVTAGLGPGGPDAATVRRILEWEMQFLQEQAAVESGPPIVGGPEAVRHISARAAAAGFDDDPALIASILDREAAYLVAIGAVGPPVLRDTT